MNNFLKKCINYIYIYIFKGNKIVKTGNNNIIDINKKCIKIKNTNIKIQGSNNKIIFGENCNITGLHILIIGNNNRILIGNNVTINASKLQPTIINAIGGKTISIGDNSLLSNNIEIHTSDYHGIYNENGKRINPDKDIYIGKKVWICLGCKILKGAYIGDGCVLGAGSIISKKFDVVNCILAGNPTKIIKEKIQWQKERKDSIKISNTN